MVGIAQDGRSVEMKPVAEVRPDESLVYQVVVKGAQPGKHKLQADVTSKRSPAAITADAETTVNMP